MLTQISHDSGDSVESIESRLIPSNLALKRVTRRVLGSTTFVSVTIRPRFRTLITIAKAMGMLLLTVQAQSEFLSINCL